MPRGGARFFRYPREEYPREVRAFKSMHTRVYRGEVITAWPLGLEGFFGFLTWMGRIPKGMKRPSVGRLDHSKGYEPGNCEWQPLRANHLESVFRNAAKRRGQKRPPFSDEWRRNIGLATSKRKHTEETKRKIGKSVSGKRNGFWGRTHTPEIKALLSALRRQRSETA